MKYVVLENQSKNYWACLQRCGFLQNKINDIALENLFILSPERCLAKLLMHICEQNETGKALENMATESYIFLPMPVCFIPVM